MAKQDNRKLLITEDMQEKVQRINDDYTAAKAKKPIDKWQKYDKYVEDDQYAAVTDTKDDWKPKPQVNICWATLRTIHANMTSGKTSINITCKRPLYDDITQQLNDVIQSYWDELDMEMLVSEAEWIRPKLGSVCYKSVWNPKKNGGKGDLDCEVVHPANVFIDPNITNPWKVQQAEFVDFVKPVSMRYVLKYCKENDPMCNFTKDQLKELLIEDASNSDTEIYGDYAENQTGLNSVSKDLFNMRGTVKLHEYWYKDDNGKLQIIWMAGQVPLKESINDKEIKQTGFYKHGKYPLVYVPYIQKDKRLDGRSELQSLIGQNSKRDGIQDVVNILLQDYLVSEKLTGQPQKAYRHGAVKNPEKLTAEAGLLIPTKGIPSQDIHTLPGVVMMENLGAIDNMLTHADRITGQWDITQGRNTSAIKTLGQTSLLMEQAMKPQNDKINTLNFGLRALVELWIDHLAEFVTDDREYVRDKNITVPNEDGTMAQKTVKEPFNFNPSMLLEAPDRIQGDSGEIEEEGTRRLYFNITMDIGATLAMTKAYMMEIGFQLWQAKLIDPEGVYKLLPEFPGKQQALDRIKQAMMQAQQPQQQPTPEQIPSEQEQPQEQGHPADELFAKLSPDQQKKLLAMPPKQQQMAMAAMIQASQGG